MRENPLNQMLEPLTTDKEAVRFMNPKRSIDESKVHVGVMIEGPVKELCPIPVTSREKVDSNRTAGTVGT